MPALLQPELAWDAILSLHCIRTHGTGGMGHGALRSSALHCLGRASIPRLGIPPGLPNSGAVPPPQHSDTWKGLNLLLSVTWLCKSQDSNAVQKQSENMAWFQPSKQSWLFFIHFFSCTRSALKSFHAEICGFFHHKRADVALAARSLQTSKADINSRSCRIYPLFTPPGYMGARAAEHTSNLFLGTCHKSQIRERHW